MSDEGDIRVALAVLSERLLSMDEKLDDLQGHLVSRSDDLEVRLRVVEKWMYAVPASLVAAVAAAVYATLN